MLNCCGEPTFSLRERRLPEWTQSRGRLMEIGFDLFGLPDTDRVAAANPQISRFPNKELACMPWVYRLTLPRFHVHQTYAAFRLRSKSAGDR
jgi:hypothetical protein